MCWRRSAARNERGRRVRSMKLRTRATGTLVSALVAVGAMLVPATAAGAHAVPGGQRVGHGTTVAQIKRDGYGVPSIYSSTLAGMWFGSGWAQAQDRMVQLDLTR